MKKILVVILSLFSLIVLQGCSHDSGSVQTPQQEEPQQQIAEQEIEQEEAPKQEQESIVELEEEVQEVDTDATTASTTVLISTDYGTMEAVLYDTTPLHRDNFIKLVKEGFYDNLLFHRVIQGFMIQGGDPDSRDAASGVRLGMGGPGYQIDAEIGEYHFKGTLAAARTGGPSNPAKRSSGSQFYIVQGSPQTEQNLALYEAQKGITYTTQQKERYIQQGGTPMLDADYTVFGEVTTGIELIDAIAAVQTAPGDRPIEDVKMTITIK